MADNWQLKAVLSANATSMLNALKGVNAMSKTTRKYLLDVGSAATHLSGKVGLPLAAVSGILAGFSVAKIKGAVTGFAEMGEAIYKGSLRAGMSVEQYQRMKYVAEQAGIGIESVEGSVGKLNRNIGMAAAGKSKDLASLFTKLGISTRDANGQLRSGMDILPDLADAFVRNKNPVVQARMGMVLFGKSWQELVPLLMEGSDGINDSMARLKRLKNVLGPEEIKGAKQFGDRLKDVDMVMKGFQMTIAKSLVPVLQPLIENLTEWWIINKKLVSTEVTKMAKDLGIWLKTIDWHALAAGAKGFVESIGWMVDKVGGAKNALIGLVIFMNLQTIAAFFGLLGAVLRLVWGLGVMTVTAIPAAVTALGTLGTAMMSAGTKANALLGTLGKVFSLGAAGFLGWEAGTLLYDNAISGTKAGDMIGSGVAHTMAFFGSEDAKAAIAGNEGGRPSLVGAANQVRASGQIQVSFKDAPPGMRVEQIGIGGDIPLFTDVGYRSYATGMP
jgi:hypothetical protein